MHLDFLRQWIVTERKRRVANVFSSEAEDGGTRRDGRSVKNKGREVEAGLSCPVEGWQPRIRVMMKGEKEKEFFSSLAAAPCLPLRLAVPPPTPTPPLGLIRETVGPTRLVGGDKRWGVFIISRH